MLRRLIRGIVGCVSPFEPEIWNILRSRDPGAARIWLGMLLRLVDRRSIGLVSNERPSCVGGCGEGRGIISSRSQRARCFERGTVGLLALWVAGCVKPNAEFDQFRPETTQDVDVATETATAQELDTQTSQEGESSPAQLTTESLASTESKSNTEASTSLTTSSSSTSSDLTSSSAPPTQGSCTPTLCYALNDQRSAISTAFVIAGRRATPFQLSSDRRVMHVEVFTGESSASSRLAIWDTSGGLPGSELVGQDWTLATQNQWQGATFAQPYALSGQTQYWVVWNGPANAQANVASAGDIPNHRFQRSGQTTWEPQNVRPMLRVYCCSS